MTTSEGLRANTALDAAITAQAADQAFDGMGFEQQAVVVFGNLQLALADMLAATPTRPRNAADVSRFFGVDKALGWNIYKMASAPSPMAVGVNVPARVSIDRFLRAAAQKELPHDLVSRVSEAFDRFERLAAAHSDDRSELDMLVVSTLPEEREKTQRARREALFHAARDIRGVSLSTNLLMVVVYPSRDDPSRLDWARVNAWVDMRRLNKNARIEVLSHTKSLKDASVTTLDGRNIEDVSDVMLPEFSSEPMPRMTASYCGSDHSKTKYTLESTDVGIRSSITAVYGDVMKAYSSRYSSPERPFVGAGIINEYPCRRGIMDLLVCDGVVPPQEPEVRIYDVVSDGHVPFGATEREADRVDFAPLSRSMGRGLQSFGSPHIPRYQELLAHVCRLRGWDGSKLHGYRLDIEYPVYSWECQMTLRLPDAPT